MYVSPSHSHPDTCTVEGCNKEYKTMGFCVNHYSTFLIYGDPLYIRREYNKHGMTNKLAYNIWKGMISRCYDENTDSYSRYGGRGIIICDRWKYSVASFINDMGDRPSKNHQIDRIDNDGNYEPGNCRWVTCAENSQNRSSTKLTTEIAKEIRCLYKNTNKSMELIANKYGVCRRTIRDVVTNKTWKEA